MGVPPHLLHRAPGGDWSGPRPSPAVVIRDLGGPEGSSDTAFSSLSPLVSSVTSSPIPEATVWNPRLEDSRSGLVSTPAKVTSFAGAFGVEMINTGGGPGGPLVSSSFTLVAVFKISVDPSHSP